MGGGVALACSASALNPCLLSTFSSPTAITITTQGFPIYYIIGRFPQESKEKKLHVWGPAAEIARLWSYPANSLREEQYPNVVPEIEVHPVHPGDTFNLGVLKVSTCASIHPVPGLCYRFDDPTGASAVFSGDTAYNQDLIKLSRGADVLVHEVSYGAQASDHNPQVTQEGKKLH